MKNVRLLRRKHTLCYPQNSYGNDKLKNILRLFKMNEISNIKKIRHS